jgi:hypothetical protein
MSSAITDPEYYSLDAVGERAEAYYDSVLRAELETDENIGKLLMIDTDTNRYVLGAKNYEMARRLAAANPNAVYTLRIGYPAVTGIGHAVKAYRDMTPEEAERARQSVIRGSKI